MSKELVKIGDVSHYYTKIEVAVVELVDRLKVGDEILIKGATTEFTQLVESIQIEHEKVTEAEAGDAIGLLVRYKVRAGDKVFRVKK
ncbi:translation elongation factor-like protein [Thermoproteota archaeon]